MDHGPDEHPIEYAMKTAAEETAIDCLAEQNDPVQGPEPRALIPRLYKKSLDQIVVGLRKEFSELGVIYHGHLLRECSAGKYIFSEFEIANGFEYIQTGLFYNDLPVYIHKTKDLEQDPLNIPPNDNAFHLQFLPAIIPL